MNLQYLCAGTCETKSVCVSESVSLFVTGAKASEMAAGLVP